MTRLIVLSEGIEMKNVSGKYPEEDRRLLPVKMARFNACAFSKEVVPMGK